MTWWYHLITADDRNWINKLNRSILHSLQFTLENGKRPIWMSITFYSLSRILSLIVDFLYHPAHPSSTPKITEPGPLWSSALRCCPSFLSSASLFGLRGTGWMVTFQGQLRLLSGLGTARSGHAGSCHCITALENSTDTRSTCTDT